MLVLPVPMSPTTSTLKRCSFRSLPPEAYTERRNVNTGICGGVSAVWKRKREREREEEREKESFQLSLSYFLLSFSRFPSLIANSTLSINTSPQRCADQRYTRLRLKEIATRARARFQSFILGFVCSCGIPTMLLARRQTCAADLYAKEATATERRRRRERERILCQREREQSGKNRKK